MASIKNLKVDSLISDYPDNSGYLIAYSGGADSSALLHLFANSVALKGKLRAIHINHGISSQANHWQIHCQNTCEQLNIPLICKSIQLNDTSENSCRVARYDCFKQELNKGEILLTAHHNQDQAETVLMKLVRGSGIKGLAGIERMKPFAKGWLARPLLECSPESLKDYLNYHQLQWIEDDSNQNNEYRRNHIRNKIIPEFKRHWPKAIDNITRTAENLQNSMKLLNHITTSQSKSLSIATLLKLPENLRSSFIYQWLSSKNLPLPSQSTIALITENFIDAKKDKNPKFENEYYQLQRWKSRIYCLKKLQVQSSSKEFIWDSSKPFILPNHAGVLKCLQDKIFTVKFNQIGQKLKLKNQQKRKTVKNLFQQHKIPPWQRQMCPYIYFESDLVSLGYSWSHSEGINIDFLLYDFEL